VTAEVSSTLITGATVWAGPACTPQPAWLLVEGSRIAGTGTGAPPAAGQVLDLPGCHVLPGFTDVHLHLTQATWYPHGGDAWRWRGLADALDAVRDRAAPLQRRPQRLQLQQLEPQLGPQILDAGRARGRQVIQQPAPAAVRGAHPGDLRAADRVEQARHRAAGQQALAAVHRGDQVAAAGQLTEPRPPRRRPGGKARAARPVRILMARLIQARQRAVSGAGQQPAVPQERIRLLHRPQRPVRAEPAAERPLLTQPGQRLHRPIFSHPARPG
jgi:hypothetical protein